MVRGSRENKWFFFNIVDLGRFCLVLRIVLYWFYIYYFIRFLEGFDEGGIIVFVV